MSRMYLPALAALAALLLAPAAHAQKLTLNSGDAVTVSGAGTVGTIGGKAVSNTTATYSTSTSKGIAVQTNGTSTLTLGAGGTFTSSGPTGYGLDAAGSGSITVNGGTITASAQNGTGLFDTGSGPVMVNGGILSAPGQNGYGMDAAGSGPVTITGGTFSGGTLTGVFDGVGLFAESSGPITISGGTFIAGPVGAALLAGGGGLLTISGGTFAANGIGLQALGGTPIMVSGGTFTGGQTGIGLFTTGSTITVTGGTFNAGPSSIGLDSGVSGTIDLFGTGFSYTVNGITTPITSGTLPSNGTAGTLNGTLLDGEALNATTFLNRATIEVNIGTPPVAAPEPSAFVALLIGALGLGALTVKARRRTA